MWSLNNFVSPSTDIFFIVAMKWTILLNRLHTTSIALYPWISSNLVMKSAVSHLALSMVNNVTTGTVNAAMIAKANELETHHEVSHSPHSKQWELAVQSSCDYVNCDPSSSSMAYLKGGRAWTVGLNSPRDFFTSSWQISQKYLQNSELNQESFRMITQWVGVTKYDIIWVIRLVIILLTALSSAYHCYSFSDA